MRLELLSLSFLQLIIICVAPVQSQDLPIIPEADHVTARLVQQMEARMSAFQKQLEKQSQKMAQQYMLLKSQQEEIHELQQLVTTQQGEMQELRQLVMTQQETINKHETQTTTQKRLLKHLSQKFRLGLAKLRTKLTEERQSTPVENSSSNRISRQLAAEGSVAFSAFLNGNLVGLGPGHIIKLNGVHINEGNGYNPNNGIFTVPMDGVYLFSLAMEDYRAHQLRVALLVDGSIKSMVATEPFHNGQNLQGTNVVILRLTAGKQVWTQIDTADGNDSIEGSTRWMVTSFSGVFLYP